MTASRSATTLSRIRSALVSMPMCRCFFGLACVLAFVVALILGLILGLILAFVLGLILA